MSIAIGNLEKSVERLADELRKRGGWQDVEIDAFRNGGVTELTGSYVELTAVFPAKEDWQMDGYLRLIFLANGYGALMRDEIGGWSMKWSEMKAEAMKRIEQIEGANR